MKIQSALSELKSYCNQKNIECSLHGSCSTTRQFELRIIDTMYVLTTEAIRVRECKIQSDLTLTNASDPRLISTWIKVFCESFEVIGWQEEVTKIVQRPEFKKIGLFLITLGKHPVGCVAIQPTNSLTGVYCLGILKNHRRIGAATASLSFLNRSYGSLFLQSLSSEGSLPFYEKRGFSVVCTKMIHSINGR